MGVAWVCMPMTQSKKRVDVKVGLSTKALIHLVNESLVYASLPDCSGALAIAPLHGLNDARTSSDPPSPGQTVKGVKVQACEHGRVYIALSADEDAGKATSTARGSSTEVVVGKLAQCKILSIRDTQINVSAGRNVRGRIHITEVMDPSDWCSGRSPFDGLTVGQVMDARVLGKQSAASAESGLLYEFSVRPSELNSSDKTLSLKSRPSLDSLKVGDERPWIVQSVGRDALWLIGSTSTRGRVHALDISDDPLVCSSPSEKFKAGQGVMARVVGVNSVAGNLDLSLRDVGASGSGRRPIAAGSVVPGLIAKSMKGQGYVVKVRSGESGLVHISDIDDVPAGDVLERYDPGDVVKVFVLDVRRGQLDLSLRPSRVDGKNVPAEGMSEVTDVKQLFAGALVWGYVKTASKKGVFVSLGRDLIGRVVMKEVSDSFVTDVNAAFPVGSPVCGRVLSIDGDGRVELSLRRSSVMGDKRLCLSDLEVGSIVKGVVKKVESFGVFVRLANSQVDGLAHKSELSDKGAPVNFQEGNQVKAKVLSIDLERKRLSLGLKASYFEDEESSDDSESENEGAGLDEIDSEQDESSSVDSSESSDSDEELEVAIPAATKRSSSFLWDDFEGSGEKLPESAGSDGDDAAGDAKMSKRKKRRLEREEEERIRRIEEARVNGEVQPESVEDFERLLVASPSSYVWIRYMAFMLSLGDIVKAREVSERALKALPLEQQSERQNIWTALLNLENLHGTPESRAAVFKDACQFNDSKTMHMKMLEIIWQNGQDDETEAFLKSLTRAFPESSKGWAQYGRFLILKKGSAAACRSVLDRALKALPRRKHIKTIVQFGQLEFKHGSVERARTIMESVISNYPRRTDIWSVFIDMELQSNNVDAARTLLDRALTLKLKSRAAKFFFKRYIRLEQEHGDEDSVKSVKDKARKYVEETYA